MNEETFINELSKHLKYLNKNILKEELEKYHNLPNYELDPVEEANKIYQNRGINIKVNKRTSFFNSISTLIEVFNSKDSKAIGQLLLFFLYLLFLLIIIKVPFIYVRDMIGSIFNGFFPTENSRIIWNLAIELAYAITTIIIFINLIKKKASELENNNQK